MEYKESVIVLIFNDNKELALQLRSATDTKYPLHWDFSAGGGVGKGEDHAAAAIRVTLDKIGVEVAVELAAEELYQDEKGQDRLFIYKARHNGPFVANSAEVQEVRFASLEVVGHMVETGALFHPEFPYIWKKGIIQKAIQS